MCFCVFVLLEASAKLLKATISYFVSIPLFLSLCSPVRMKELGFRSTYFHEISYLSCLKNMPIKFKVHKSLTRITCTLHEGQQNL
jgi:hypothetical protein